MSDHATSQNQPDVELLTLRCKIPTRVYWTTLNGERHEGTLVDWDNGTALVMRADSGTVVAVRVA